MGRIKNLCIFFFKLSAQEANSIKPPMTKYEPLWKEAVYYIDPNKTKTTVYLKLFEKAYNKLSGK